MNQLNAGESTPTNMWFERYQKTLRYFRPKKLTTCSNEKDFLSFYLNRLNV